ncbi:hypothetical protein K1719_039669 [Acacia pycnantha]|nr:hypothetical protein K1719_039669 [Acacia pycnantha]
MIGALNEVSNLKIIEFSPRRSLPPLPPLSLLSLASPSPLSLLAASSLLSGLALTLSLNPLLCSSLFIIFAVQD